MQIFEALTLKGARLRGRIGVENRGPAHVALLEAHALALFEIDRRKKNQGFHFR
jgi:hypothetical protein